MQLNDVITSKPYTNPPLVIDHQPLSGEVIALHSVIRIEFSTEMDRQSVKDALTITPADEALLLIRWENDKVLIIEPPESGYQKSTRYLLRLSPQAQSMTGEYLPYAFKLVFTTVSDLKVLHTFPEDEAHLHNTDSPLQVVFNQPLVSDSCLATMINNNASCPHDILDLTPPILGFGKWVRNNIFEFKPYHDWKAGEIYTIQVTHNLISLSEMKMDNPYIWRFSIPHPEIVDIFPADGTYNADPGIEIVIRFNVPMDEVITGSHFQLLSATGDFIPGVMEWYDDGKQMIFTPTDLLNMQTSYRVVLGERARSRSNISIMNAIDWQFSTVPFPAVKQDLTAGRTRYAVDVPLLVQFTGKIDTTTFENRISISPTIAQFEPFFDPDSGVLSLYGHRIPGERYCVTFHSGISDYWGHSIPAPVTNCYDTADLPSSLSPINDRRVQTLPVGSPEKLRFRNVNINRTRFSLYSLHQDDFFQDEAPTDLPMRQWQQEFTPVENQSVVVDVDIWEGSGVMPTGLYVLEYQVGEDPTYTILSVVDRNVIVKQTTDEVLAWITEVRGGTPVSQTAVSFYSPSGTLIAGGTTNDLGVVRVPIGNLDIDRGPITSIVGTPGSDGFGFAQIEYNTPVAKYGSGIPSGYHPVVANKVFIWPQKNNFVIGEAIQFSGYLLDSDNHRYNLSKEPQDLILHLSDMMSKDVYTIDAAVPAGTYFEGIIPSDALLPDGLYTLSAASSDGVPYATHSPIISIRGSAYQDYILKIQANSSEVSVSDTMMFTVTLKDADGYSVPYSSFAYKIIAYPNLDIQTLNNPHFMEEINQFGGRQLAFGHGSTDAAGSAIVNTLLDYGVNNGTGLTSNFILRIQVTYTDPSGMLHTANDDVSITRMLSHVNLGIDTRINTAGERMQVNVSAIYADNVPTAGQNIRIVISKLEPDTDSLLGPSSDAQTISDVTVLTDREGTATIFFTPDTNGQYRIQACPINTPGLDADEGCTRSSFWVVGGPNSPSAITHETWAPVLDRDVYHVGEVAKVLLPISQAGPYYILQLIEKNGIQDSQVIHAEGPYPLLEIPILESFAPSSHVSFIVILLDENGLSYAQIGTVEIVVNSPATTQFHIEIMKDQLDYRPGDQGIVRIRVTDDQLLPVNAHLLISIQESALIHPQILELKTALDRWSPLVVDTGMGTRVIPEAPLVPGDPLDPILDYDPEDSGGAKFRLHRQTTVDGEVSFEVNIPSKPGSLRIFALAFDDDGRLGFAGEQLIITNTMNIRQVGPQYFVVGDQAEFSCILDNPSAFDTDLKVAVTSLTGMQLLQRSQVYTISVPAYSQRRISWDVYIPETQHHPLAEVEISVTSDQWDIENRISKVFQVPLVYYSYPLSRHSSGLLKNEGHDVGAFFVPEQISDFSTLSINVHDDTNSIIQTGIEHLLDYPLDSTEAAAVRLMATQLSDQLLLNNITHDQGTTRDIQQATKIETSKLAFRQNEDGGWGWMLGTSDLSITALTAFGLYQSGVSTNHLAIDMLDRAATYMTRAISDSLSTSTFDASSAFALYVLALIDHQPPPDAVTIMYTGRSMLGISGKVFLALALDVRDPADTRVRTLMQDVQVLAEYEEDMAYWRTDANMAAHTDIQTTSLVLFSLQYLDMYTEMYDAIFRWLMHQQHNAYWTTPQDTLWALMSLVRYAQLNGQTRANYDWAVTLNDQPALSNTNHDIVATVNQNTLHISGKTDLAIVPGVNTIGYERQPGLGTMFYSASYSFSLPWDLIE
ncbi:MAG: Ig-like domain-containing protein, partial [Anaerolineae bacterium]|nr:Ig-like domain-containing protein [Anaerolineae bacterium]